MAIYHNRIFLYFICMIIGCSLLCSQVVADSPYKNTWVLLVGIEDYPESSNDLNYPLDDVTAIESVLVNYCGVPSQNIFKYTDDIATKANIKYGIYQLSQHADSEDLVIFYFSGHGTFSGEIYTPEPDETEEYIVAHDKEIRDDELQNWFYGVESKNTVLIIDSCMSGGIAKSIPNEPIDESLTSDDSKNGSIKDFINDLHLQKYVIIMASEDSELSYEYPFLKNGAFTYYICEGLTTLVSDSNSDSWISFEEAFSYAKIVMSYNNYPQHPQILDGNPFSDVKIVPVISPAITPIPPTDIPCRDSSYDNIWAILVGINDYQDSSISDLENPLNDVQDIESVLRNKCGLSPTNILKYTDSQATKNNIKNGIFQLSGKVSSEDLVIFFFSGHGDYLQQDFSPIDETDRKDESIAPYDTRIDGGNLLNVISDDDLQSWFDTVNSCNTVIILDSCHSGGITKSLVNENVDRTTTINEVKKSQTKDISRDINSYKYLVLMASDDKELSVDSSDLNNGLFTYYFVEGLSTKSADVDKDSWISFEEAFWYAKPLIYDYPDDNPQIPQIFDGDIYHEIEIVPLTSTPSPATSQYEYVQEWGAPGSGMGQFHNPWGVAVHSTEDKVYVSDATNHRIQVFSKNGVFNSSWGSYGTREVQFHYPYGIALNEKLGRVYISEKNGDRIQILTENGEYFTYWGNDFWFLNLGEICIDSTTGEVYVADTGHNRIQVFDQDGNFLREWGSLGTGEGQFQSPIDVEFDQNSQKVYVSDQQNHRIQVFNERGWYITQFGTFGSGNGQLNGPTGIALNSSGYLFVVDQGNSRIQVYSPDGKYVTGWGSSGSGDYQFDTPCGIDIDTATDYVYVGDSGNNRVILFKQKNSPSITPTTPTLTPTPTTITPTPTQTNPTTLTADFSASQTSGAAPLTVRFQDASQGNPTGWMWDINGDGFRDYSDRSIEHVYTSPGYYSVTFSITRNQELVTITRPNYIHVLGENLTPDTMTLDLQTGWNLLSTPKTLAEGHRTRSEVFSGINTAGHSTFGYNAQTQSWTQLNSNDEIQPVRGIWIYSATPAQVSLTFSDNPISSTNELSPGWNSIGFSKVDPVSAKDALLPVQNAWAQVLGFNAASQFYETSIINGGSGTHSDSNLVYPGKGYWVFMNSQGTLS